jgi:hypothetical protein
LTVQIRAIAIYSHDGERRDIRFNLGALNIVTARPRLVSQPFWISSIIAGVVQSARSPKVKSGEASHGLQYFSTVRAKAS